MNTTPLAARNRFVNCYDYVKELLNLPSVSQLVASCSFCNYTPLPTTRNKLLSTFVVFVRVKAHACFGWTDYQAWTFSQFNNGTFQSLTTWGYSLFLMFVKPNILLQFLPLYIRPRASCLLF